jgi:hypothetical protein
MKAIERIALLAVRGSSAFSDGGGATTGRRRGWQDVAAALAAPRSKSPTDQRPPASELGRLIVLQDISTEELRRLLQWVGGTERESAAAVSAVIGATPCTGCGGSGEGAAGTDCQRCGGAGVKNLGERPIAELLGVSRHRFRKDRAAHDARVARVHDLIEILEGRLRGS